MGHSFNNFLGAVTGVGPRLNQMALSRLQQAQLRGELWQEPGSRAALFTDPQMMELMGVKGSQLPRGSASMGAYPQLSPGDEALLPYITQMPGGLPPQVMTKTLADIQDTQSQTRARDISSAMLGNMMGYTPEQLQKMGLGITGFSPKGGVKWGILPQTTLPEGAVVPQTPLGTGSDTQGQVSPNQPRVLGPGGQSNVRKLSSGVNRFQNQIQQISSAVGVDPVFVTSVMQQESGGRQQATSPKGAHGVMQLMPDTFNQLAPRVMQITGRPTADINDPTDNLVAGTLYLKDGLAWSGGDPTGAARYYHGGPDTRIHGPKTQAYGDEVSARYAALKGGGQPPAQGARQIGKPSGSPAEAPVQVAQGGGTRRLGQGAVAAPEAPPLGTGAGTPTTAAPSPAPGQAPPSQTAQDEANLFGTSLDQHQAQPPQGEGQIGFTSLAPGSSLPAGAGQPPSATVVPPSTPSLGVAPAPSTQPAGQVPPAQAGGTDESGMPVGRQTVATPPPSKISPDDLNDALANDPDLRSYIKERGYTSVTQALGDYTVVQRVLTNTGKRELAQKEGELTAAERAKAGAARTSQTTNARTAQEVLTMYEQDLGGGRTALDASTESPTWGTVTQDIGEIPLIGKPLENILSPGGHGIPGVPKEFYTTQQRANILGDPAAIRMEQLQGSAPLFQRALGDVGNLNQQEQEAVRRYFLPNPNYTKARNYQILQNSKQLLALVTQKAQAGDIQGAANLVTTATGLPPRAADPARVNRFLQENAPIGGPR